MSSRFDELRDVLRSMDSSVVAVESPTVLSIICELRGADVSEARLRTLHRPGRHALGSSSSRPVMAPTARAGKFTAIVPMRGVANYSLDWPGYAYSTPGLARSMNQLCNDASVESIVLDIDSPGGHVTGTQEAADAVWQASKRKPVVALVNALCASAAYWIGSQASTVVGVPSADVGSIGVLMLHIDQSKMLADIGIKPTFIFAGRNKVEGNALEPLGASAKAFYQAEVNKTYTLFVSSVARGRGVSVDDVRNKMGEGRCFGAQDALRARMIDKILTPDAALVQIASGTFTARAARAERAGDEFRSRLADLARDPGKTSADTYRQRLALLREG